MPLRRSNCRPTLRSFSICGSIGAFSPSPSLLSVLTGMIFSLIPALQCIQARAGSRVQRRKLDGWLSPVAPAQCAASSPRSRFRLSCLISAGLIVRSLQAAQRMRPGFNPQNAVALSIRRRPAGLRRRQGPCLLRRCWNARKQFPACTRSRPPMYCRSVSITARTPFTSKVSRPE